MGVKRGQTTIQAKGGQGGPLPVPRLSPDASVGKSSAPARILVVEDQEDVRRMVATALEIEGYEVSEAANAHEGLRQLEEHHFHLVLTDYAMPGGTGTWMLQEATRRGLMARTGAMIVTAHPDVRELSDVAVINKPLDLDYFLDQVRKILEPLWGSDRSAVLRANTGGKKIELVLYICSTSIASIQARQNLERLLARFDSSQVRYRVVDLLLNPLAGEIDRIAFTPTLVRQFPGPRTWVLGNLRHAEILTELLESSGIGTAE